VPGIHGVRGNERTNIKMFPASEEDLNPKDKEKHIRTLTSDIISNYYKTGHTSHV
jgi:hypothetical protein